MCYYGNISPFLSDLYQFSDKYYAIFVITLHITINLTGIIRFTETLYKVCSHN